MTESLYNQDYSLWLEQVIEDLESRNLSNLDTDNVIELLKETAIQEKIAAKGLLITINWHFLFYEKNPSNKSLVIIDNYRDNLIELIGYSPSLKGYCEGILEECYQKAVRKLSIELEVKKETFPNKCPFLLEEILNPDYIPKSLYDKDYYLWLIESRKQLKNGNLSNLDTKNLIDELDTLRRNQQESVSEALIFLFEDLLKHWKCRGENRKGIIREHRRTLGKLLTNSPSLNEYVGWCLDECYQEARLQVTDETDLDFPDECPFLLEDVLNPDFLPE